MDRPTKTIISGDMSVTVRQASVMDGLARQAAMRAAALPEAQEKNGKKSRKKASLAGEIPAVLGAKLYILPALLAVTEEVQGLPWPISLEDFLELPDDLGSPWIEAVFELNPHWDPNYQPDTIQAPQATVQMFGYTIHVRTARMLEGLIRDEKMFSAEQVVIPGESDLVREARTKVFPVLLAVTTRVEGGRWPMNFDDFLKMPDELVFNWHEQVFACNPHWASKPALTEVAYGDNPELEKKDARATLSTSA